MYDVEDEAVISIDVELLAFAVPHKQFRIITRWLAFYEEEAYKTWNLAVKGEHFEKIPPLK